MILKKIIQAIVVIALSVCLFFAFGFEGEIEYRTEFVEGEYLSEVGDIVTLLGSVVTKLTEFRDMLESEKGVADLSSIPALDNAIAECNSLIALLNAKITDFNTGNFVPVSIEEEIEVEWEKDGVGYEAEAEVELEVENEGGMVEVEIEYEDEIEEDEDSDDDYEDYEEDEDSDDDHDDDDHDDDDHDDDDHDDDDHDDDDHDDDD